MIHSAVTRPQASPAQIGLAILAVLALTFSFFSLAQPVRAEHVDGATVQLHQDLGDGVSGENPGEFAGDEEECADVEEGTTLFHFVANNLADGTEATESTLYVQFAGEAEPRTYTGYYPSGSTQPTVHWDVVVEGDATLLDAWAVFNVDQTEDAKLLLSHICGGGEGEVSEDLTLVKQVNGAATAGIGFTLEGGSEMFTDASGQILFEDLTEGDWTLTETSNPNEDCETGGSVTISVAADGSITVTDDDETDGLVIISFNAETNVLVLNNVCEADVDNGLLEVEKFFCPTDGETRTEFDVFGPAEPQMGAMNETEGDAEGCTIGAGVEFTVYAADGETWVADLVTGENGIVEHELAPGDYVLCENASGECAAFSIASNQITAIVVVNYVADEEGPGLLEVEKFFCPTDGETRTEFDVFGPTDPTARVSGTEVDTEDCTVGADVSFTLYSVGGEEWTEIDTLVTDEDGIIEIELAAGDYALCEDMSEECVEFSIGPDGAVTAIVVVNYVSAPQGQIKILKYFCDAEEDSVEFYLEGQAPNLENCDPGDAEFTLDGGAAFSTEGGIAVIWADEGTHTLAEVGTDASIELEVVEGEITTVIVLNNEGAEEEQGQLQVLKFFCDGEAASTEFFAEGDEPDLSECEPGDAMFRVADGEAFSTVEGEAWVNLDAGTGYVLTELSSEASTTFDITAGEVTTITVVNTVVSEVPQGQIKILKYACESDEDGVEFVLEGDAPADLEDCDPADAEFSLDDGASFSTTDGIAIVWADEGTHTLAEVETSAGVELEVVAGAITTVIVLNHFEGDVSGGGETPSNGNGGNGDVEGDVQGGQGGPGTLPDTATGQPNGLPVGILALLLLAGLSGLGALNLQAVRRRIG